jgi:type II secretory pathway pseudopilin PulG
MKRVYYDGFTFIEFAIVLGIVALILGGLFGPLSTRLESEERQKTQAMMEDIKKALIGFAQINGRLPCPDAFTSGDGIEDPAVGGACTLHEGWVPWTTLGTPQGDIWGNRFRYCVTKPRFTTPDNGTCDTANNNPLTSIGDFDLCASGSIDIQTRDSAKALVNVVGAVPALIISHGHNGYGGTRIDGTARPPVPATNDDEDHNATNTCNPLGGATKRMRTFTAEGTPCSDAPGTTSLCEFDDLVVWISPNILKNRMVTAGRLP